MVLRRFLLILLCSICLGRAAMSQDHLLRILPSRSGGATRQETQDTLSLVQVAQIPPAYGNRLAFGDTDHDGRNEVFLNWRESSGWHLHVFEEQGANSYQLEYLGPQLFPFATGDLDRDGKSELVGQTDHLQVYESSEATSYPTQLVWSTVTVSTYVTEATVGDTDRDGRMEIIYADHSIPGFIIYENTGDDAFAQVFTSQEDGEVGEFVVADLDGDGLIEIAFPTTPGTLQVYESPSDNVWREVFRDSTELFGASALEGGRDTDGNGEPELFMMGNFWDGTRPLWTTYVYEPVCDNRFVCVDTLQAYDGYSGGPANALGDLDGVPSDEYVMRGGFFGVWIYRPVALGDWRLLQVIPDPLFHAQLGVYIRDVNRNGRGELFWTTSANLHSIVLEDTSASPPTSSDQTHQPRMLPLTISPNPVRVQASLLFPLGTSAREAKVLGIYDIAGRLADMQAVTCDASGQILWRVGDISAGVYFLRLRNRYGSVIASGRTVVVR